MSGESNGRREAPERRAWPGPASCAAAVLGLVAFFATTELTFDFSYSGEHSGLGFNLASNMDWWYHVCLIVWFVAAAALGVYGIARTSRLKVLSWLGALVNSFCAVALAVFLALALAQGAFR